MRHAAGESEVVGGFGDWIEGVTDMPGTPAKMAYVGDIRPVRVAAAAAWTEADTLVMHWRYTETAHRHTVICRFGREATHVELLSSVNDDDRISLRSAP